MRPTYWKWSNAREHVALAVVSQKQITRLAKNANGSTGLSVQFLPATAENERGIHSYFQEIEKEEFDRLAISLMSDVNAKLEELRHHICTNQQIQ